MTQQYCLASWLSSTGIFHHSLLPHVPSVCLSAVNSSPCPGIAPQSLSSSSQLLHLLGDLCPCPGMYGCGKDCLFSFHLGCHRSAASLSALNVSPLTQTVTPMWGSDPCFNSLTVEGRSSPVFPPSSFILLGFAWFYVFFSAGQVLLSTLSWCSVCTSVSEGVFLMYLWRERYSTSTYSSTILFSLGVHRSTRIFESSL